MHSYCARQSLFEPFLWQEKTDVPCVLLIKMAPGLPRRWCCLTAVLAGLAARVAV